MVNPAKLKKGDVITLRCEVTKVLDDGSIVVRFPGYGYPIHLSSKTAQQFDPAKGLRGEGSE